MKRLKKFVFEFFEPKLLKDLKTFLKEQLGEKVVGKCIIVRDNEKKSRGFGYAYL